MGNARVTSGQSSEVSNLRADDPPEDISRLDSVFKALASAHRREILRILAGDGRSGSSCCTSAEVCSCVLSERLGLAQSTISHHMSLMRKAGLVETRKEGTWVYYALRRDALEEIARELARL